MIRRPPRSTLFPYPPLFRSLRAVFIAAFVLLPASTVTTLLFGAGMGRSEEHTSELQSQSNLVCRLLLEKKKKQQRSEHPRGVHACDVTRRIQLKLLSSVLIS